MATVDYVVPAAQMFLDSPVVVEEPASLGRMPFEGPSEVTCDASVPRVEHKGMK
jgi:hypothetical protein